MKLSRQIARRESRSREFIHSDASVGRAETGMEIRPPRKDLAVARYKNIVLFNYRGELRRIRVCGARAPDVKQPEPRPRYADE